MIIFANLSKTFEYLHKNKKLGLVLIVKIMNSGVSFKKHSFLCRFLPGESGGLKKIQAFEGKKRAPPAVAVLCVCCYSVSEDASSGAGSWRLSALT